MRTFLKDVVEFEEPIVAGEKMAGSKVTIHLANGYRLIGQVDEIFVAPARTGLRFSVTLVDLTEAELLGR